MLPFLIASAIENEGNGKSHFSVSVSENATEGIFRGSYKSGTAGAGSATSSCMGRASIPVFKSCAELEIRIITAGYYGFLVDFVIQ